MKLKRHIESALHTWKKSTNRKPLILRGARQVGKTTLILEFAKNYANSISINLEKAKDLAYFKNYEDVEILVDALFINHDIASSQREHTLLFIDEIQESVEAIKMLRYFYEALPSLHVIAAGSLLEHVMGEVKNFPVGRVEYLYLSPLNFLEYIEAKGHYAAMEHIQHIPVQHIAHQTLLELFHEYAIIGGMPEIVSRYLETKSIADLPKIYESIWSTYKEDIKKYAANKNEERIIKHITESAYLYVDQRIKFEGFGQSNYRSRETGEAFRNLNDARIIQLIYPTTETSPPIKPNLKKSPKLQFLDTGLINYELKIQASLLAMKDLSKAYKGAIIPHLITQELISLNSISYVKPNFWVREKNQSSSEIDIVLPYKNYLIPIEIKSGKSGTLKSLHQFIEQVNHPYAIRMYGGIFSIEQQQTPRLKKPYYLMNIPYYLGTKIKEYIAYLVDNKPFKMELSQHINNKLS